MRQAQSVKYTHGRAATALLARHDVDKDNLEVHTWTREERRYMKSLVIQGVVLFVVCFAAWCVVGQIVERLPV